MKLIALLVFLFVAQADTKIVPGKAPYGLEFDKSTICDIEASVGKNYDRNEKPILVEKPCELCPIEKNKTGKSLLTFVYDSLGLILELNEQHVLSLVWLNEKCKIQLPKELQLNKSTFEQVKQKFGKTKMREADQDMLINNKGYDFLIYNGIEFGFESNPVKQSVLKVVVLRKRT